MLHPILQPVLQPVLRSPFDRRPTALTISQLLPSGAGRVAAIYSDPAKPSYDECIQKNMDAMGPELVVNGGFDSASGWTLANFASITGGKLNVGTAGAGEFATRTDAAIVPGRAYCVSFTLNVISGSNNVSAKIGGSLGGIVNTSGRHTEVIVAGSTGTIILQGRSTGTTNCTVDDFSVREIDLSKCVLFADAAGQTPVVYPIGAGQGKGLLLDRSAGLVRGPELVVNGGLDTETSWTKGTGWNIGAGVATKTAGTQSDLYQLIFVDNTAGRSAGKMFEISLTAQVTAGGFSVSVGGYDFSPTNTTSGAKRFFLLAGNPSSNGTLYIRGNATFAGTIDNISVRELPGHHQQQPTAAARGEFSRRYNLLTATEDFSQSVWTKLRASITDSVRVEATETNVNGVGVLQVTSGAPANSTFQARVRLQRGNKPWAAMAVIASGTSGARLFVNLDTAQIGTIVPIGTGVVQDASVYADGSDVTIVFTVSTSGPASMQFVVYPAVSGDGDLSCTIGDFGFCKQADLRLSADAIPNIPAYQRVTTASDYDEVGFPTYWRAQTDDWAKSHMNPNGATKAYVFWAGQKMSDAAAAVGIELSASSTSNTGTLALFIPPNAGPGLSMRSRGSSAGVDIPGTIAAPARAVAIGHGNIDGDIASININGTTTTNTADQGSGTYLEHDVFFASRAGTSLFANIREYAPPTILFLQPADSLSASNLSKLQRGYAKAVGVTL